MIDLQGECTKWCFLTSSVDVECWVNYLAPLLNSRKIKGYMYSAPGDYIKVLLYPRRQDFTDLVETHKPYKGSNKYAHPSCISQHLLIPGFSLKTERERWYLPS